MKNKDLYDLTELDISISYQTDGCGHKVEKPYFITIKYEGETIVKNEMVSKALYKWLLEWLEK